MKQFSYFVRYFVWHQDGAFQKMRGVLSQIQPPHPQLLAVRKTKYSVCCGRHVFPGKTTVRRQTKQREELVESAKLFRRNVGRMKISV
jgi:hypothetical protein